MTPQQQREEVSKAYVAAVAAQGGFKLGTWTQDDDCLDVTVGAAGTLGGGTLAGPKLDLQLKASTDQGHDHPEHIAWSLSRAHYDKLRHDAVLPRLLVVLMLPEKLEHSVEHGADKLVMRRCAYWTCLLGADAIRGTAESTTVHLAKANVFSPDALKSLLEKVSREETL
ncbi:MAG: DUF4365 domain-containing protein [Nannocystaceae bacterium]|nr:DUF4365 domain-containing protein [Nannocystaceae bacterium]